MKIALCFSGQPRFLRECYPGIKKHILDGNDVDVYGHIWWSNEYKGKTIRFHSKHKYSQEDNLGEVFKELYKPKDCIIESQKDFDFSWYEGKTSCLKNAGKKIEEYFVPESLFVHTSQYYSIMKANELRKKSEIEYDVVIRCRTDTIFDNNRFIKDTIKKLDLSKGVYIASSMNGGPKYCGHFPNTYSDWFFLGKPKFMNIFCPNMYEQYSKVMKNGLIHIYNYIPEMLKRISINGYLFDSGLTVYRKDMRNTEKLHQNIEFYFEHKEHEDLPYFAKNIDFGVVKK